LDDEEREVQEELARERERDKTAAAAAASASTTGSAPGGAGQLRERLRRVCDRFEARITGRDAVWVHDSPQPTAAPLAVALSPELQLEHLIRHATARSNLAVMFEGWMSWI